MSQRTHGHRCAVLGHPIEHSLSPILHRAAYAELGLDWTYEALDVTEAGLSAFLDGLDASWVGLSLTMPLKEAVLPLLTSRSPLADLAQAANTVIVDGDKKHGHNTDVGGVVAALHEHGINTVDEATILGTGATARSSLIALAELGVERVGMVGRSPVAHERVRALGAELGVAITPLGWNEAANGLVAPVVISTVPANVAALVADAVPPVAGVLFDVLYDPWPTPLATAWARCGVVIGGLDLLLHQASGQVALMTGQPAPVPAMRAAGVAALTARRAGAAEDSRREPTA